MTPFSEVLDPIDGSLLLNDFNEHKNVLSQDSETVKLCTDVPRSGV